MKRLIDVVVRCKLFGKMGTHKLRVKLPSDDVLAWDPVAGYYTACHSITKAAKDKAIALAVEAQL